MAIPTMYYEQALDALKGWPDESGLDHAAKLSSDVEFDIPAGRAVQLNADGEFIPGVVGAAMGIFLINGTTGHHTDVSNPGGSHWTPIAPTGVLSGLVATGAFELETTEFDTAQAYVPNETLAALPHLTDVAIGGVLTNLTAVPFTNAVVGVVSRGVTQNSHRVDALAFWPVWLPAAP
jgi:hypothetical protein